MVNYGRIKKDGSLLQSSRNHEGYKPLRYADIPDDFDETTHFITQSEPVEKNKEIYVGIEIGELEIEDDEEFDEDIF